MGNSKKINMNIFLTVLIFLLYAGFLAFMIVSDIISKYILMRSITYIKIIAFVLSTVALVIGTQIFRAPKVKINKIVFAILLLPLLAGFYLTAHDINSFAFGEKNTGYELNYGLENNIESGEGAKGKNFNSTVFESPLKDEKEVHVNERNFLSWVDELYRNPKRYSGRPFDMTANVYYHEIDGEKKAFAGRYVKISDLEELEKQGIIIKTDKSFNDDEWVNIKGTMSTETLHGQIIPVVIVNSIEKTEYKGTEFIYGY